MSKILTAGVFILVAYALPAMADEPMKFIDYGILFGVAAEGDITDSTPTDFVNFLSRNSSKTLPEIVFNSGGATWELD